MAQYDPERTIWVTRHYDGNAVRVSGYSDGGRIMAIIACNRATTERSSGNTVSSAMTGVALRDREIDPVSTINQEKFRAADLCPMSVAAR